MIVYTVVGQGQYVDLADGLKMKPEGQWSMYVNLTNRCTCSLFFSLIEPTTNKIGNARSDSICESCK